MGGAARRLSLLVRSRHPRLPRRQSAHQADAVQGVVSARGVVARARRDVSVRGVHASEADVLARQEWIFAGLHVLHVALDEVGARNVSERARPRTGCGLLPAELLANDARYLPRAPRAG